MKLEYNIPKLYLGTLIADDWYDTSTVAPTTGSSAGAF